MDTWLLAFLEFLLVAGCNGVLLIVWVDPFPFRFWEHKENHEERGTYQGDIKPPKVSPAHMSGHCSGDDWCDHEGTHVNDPVEGVPFASVVEEENVCNNSWLNGFCRTSADSVQTE